MRDVAGGHWEECIEVGWTYGKKGRGQGREQSRCPQTGDQNKTTVMTAIVSQCSQEVESFGRFVRRMEKYSESKEVWRQAMEMPK